MNTYYVPEPQGQVNRAQLRLHLTASQWGKNDLDVHPGGIVQPKENALYTVMGAFCL